YQAGASTRGREFAARHAECVFVSGPSRKVVRDLVADVRRRAADNGRDPAEVLFFTSFSVIAGRSSQEAKEKYEEYLSYADPEAAAALVSGWTGIDFSRFRPEDPVTHVPTQHMQSAVERYTTADPGRVWTFGEVLRRIAVGGGGGLAVGSPAEVADELQGWIEDTGIDGFNLGYALAPQSYVDFVDLVVPELQRRGVYKKDYRPGTLREKFYGAGRARLPDAHPAAAARR
ncbi:MAG: LLM class flavin-dependent oxidoreductase, partial [Xenophilus sp.]